MLWFLYKLRDTRNRILWGHKEFKDKLIYHLIIVCATMIVLFFSYSVFRYFNISYGVGNLVVAIINGIFIGIIIATFKN